MTCQYRNKESHPVCMLGMYGGMPSFRTCNRCVELGQNNPEYAEKAKNKITGLGDIVHKIAQPIAGILDKTINTNIKGCGSCKKRREALNSMFPIKIE